jgi:hypothetical protein
VSVGARDRALAETETAGTWRVDTIALPSGRTNTDLWGVSCDSPTACVAVGTSGPLRAAMPFSEVLRGTRWKIVATAKLAGVASANLNAVSCASATDCRAVGSWSPASGNGGTLVEVYNGSGWILDKTPSLAGSGYLSGVSCLRATIPALCTAVGSVTVGTGVEPLVEQANGYRWRIVTVPNPASSQYASLASISCPQPTSCVAVGSALVGDKFRGFSEIENLLRWTIATPRRPLAHASDNLLGVSCPLSISSCRAVGFYGTAGTLSLAEAWNGHRWAIQTSSTPRSNLAELLGVSCVTVNSDGVACTAAGEYQGSPMGPSHPLAEHN